MRPLPILGAVLVAAVCLALDRRACAEDEAGAAAKALLAEIKAACADRERTGLAAAVEKLAQVHNGLDKPALKKKLQAAAGRVLADDKAGAARSLAAAALGAFDDPVGAYKHLAKMLPKPTAKEVVPAQLAALKATAVHGPEAAIPVLLKLVQKGKSLPAAKEAIVALGGYAKSKKRAAILKELLEAMRRHHAAAEAAEANPKAKGAGALAWRELGEPLIAAANRLTGQTYPSVTEWMAAYGSNKKNLAALFPSTAE